MQTARLAVHHADADLVAICDTEPMSECSRSDGQLPLLEHLLCLSSLLTLAPPPDISECGLMLPDQQDFGV